MRQICSLFMQSKSCMPARPTVDAIFSTDEEKVILPYIPREKKCK